MAEQAAPPPIDHHETATCLGCRYPLRGLAESRCPECGRDFDPFDPMTMRVPGISRRPPPKPAPFWGLMIVAAVVLTPFTMLGMTGGNSAGTVIAGVGWIGLLIAWRVRNVKERAAAVRGEPLTGTRLWRPVVGVLLVVSILSGIGWHRCPHGRYYRLGPLTLFRGDALTNSGGGPCRNYVRGTRFELPANWYLIVS